jgi:Raf kinase inhibitor-like YbhB/YbcL family protein
MERSWRFLVSERVLIWSSGFLLLLGCAETKPSASPIDVKGVPAMKITSTAFEEGGIIPKKYTGDGDDVSPPLGWSGAPAGTKCFALICDDPDAPTKDPWVHWVMFNIAAKNGSESFELPEAIPIEEDLGERGKQGKNSFGKIGYGGPAPPPGKLHRYFFKIYALDKALDLKPAGTKQQLEQAMKGHLLAHGQLMGKYSR